MSTIRARSPSSASAALVHLRGRRSFRSDAALELLAQAREQRTPYLALYNYPSFSGAFSALFVRLFHDRLRLPCLILPFSSRHPFLVEDVCMPGLEKCFLLDFIGPTGFASELAPRSSCEVIAFEHRRSAVSRIGAEGSLALSGVIYNVNTEKSSSMAAYEYFCGQLVGNAIEDERMNSGLLEKKDQGRVEKVLKYIEDGDLRKWTLPDSQAFNIGLKEWRSKLNCITNQYMFEELLKMETEELTQAGCRYLSTRENSAAEFLDKAFSIRLGRGLYGKCLCVRADGYSDLSDEIGKQLSVKSAASGLRPIGAVVYMQGNNLKMCLRSIDDRTDTSEVAKAYGGGGNPPSSSFIIRMDEYNHWLAVNST
ncbi:hypothetical protein MLD38_013722 [Melastoma candidum]|uniref:Uncharacterized protein n=1 Tax=Melastoma candidum TaxID=119954 RepID=A0ACB9RDL7_9MYRT|nr:hypothetical protein MLD38_013722 [Melastoma candidum]